MDELFRVTLAELEIRQRQAMQLREALLPLLDEIGTGGDLDYHFRTDGHAERLQAALSTPAVEPKCGTCGGTGEVDSGAPDPQGYFIDMPCPDCTQPVATWLAQHDAEVMAQERARCLTRRYPIPFRAMEAVLTVYLPSEEDRVVREWLDNIAAAIREADDE